MSGDRLYAAFKTIAKRATPAEDLADLVYGVVKSVNPWRVEIENKYTIEATQILLSPLCYGKTIRITIPAHTHQEDTGQTGPAGSVDMELEVWRGLAAGDRVIMLRHSGGQSFYVLQRAGDDL